jgi:hypothetical protein
VREGVRWEEGVRREGVLREGVRWREGGRGRKVEGGSRGVMRDGV